MSIEPPLMRDVLNGVLNSRVAASGLFSSFPATQMTLAELALFISSGSNPVVTFAFPPGDVRRYGAISLDVDSTFDSAPAIQAAVSSNNSVFVPPFQYGVGSVIDLPRVIRVSGSSRRGFGVSPYGSTLVAKFAGPVLRYAPGALTAVDILLENFSILGDQGTYGAGDGLTFTKCAGVDLRYMVLDNFGTHNVRFGNNDGSYNFQVKDVYSARAGNANFYIGGQYSKLSRCLSDAGLYGAYIGPGGDHLSINDACHFEGATTTGVHILAGYLRMVDSFIRITTTGANGIYMGAGGAALIGNEVFGDDGVAGKVCALGIDIPGGVIEYRLVGNLVRRFATALRRAEGFGTSIGNVLEGTAVGEELIAGTFIGTDAANMISGPTSSLLNTSGAKYIIIGNRLDDGTGVYKAPTITAGIPMIAGANATSLISSGLGRFDLTYNASMNIDASVADGFWIVATNGTAFTINLPTNPSPSRRIVVHIKNTSGGALGAVTWAAGYKLSAWTSPATGTNRSIEFQYDDSNGNWVEMTRTTVDVPN